MQRETVCRGEVTAYLSLIFILLITFIGGIMESASIQLAKNYRRADANRAMESVFAEYQKELLDEYDLFALDGSYETGSYGEQNIQERLSYYGAGNMEHKVERIQFLTDRGCSGFCEQAAAYIEHRYGIDIMKDMLGMTSVWGQQEEKAEVYAREERSCQEHLDGLLSEQGGELPEEGNPIAYAGQLKRSPLLTLVMPKDKAVSEKQIESGDVLSGREKNTGYGEFSDVAEEPGNLSSLVLGEYLLEHFSKFTDTECTGALDYELEYILAGKASDKENLEAVAGKLLLLRFVPNYTYIQSVIFCGQFIHAILFCSLLLRLLSFDFSLRIFLAQAGQYLDAPEPGTYSTPHTVQFLAGIAAHRFVGMICNSSTKPMNL